MFYKVFILSFVLSSLSHALWTEKEALYYKNKYLKEEVKKEQKISFVSQETMNNFTKKYGKDALRRLKYINKKIESLQNASTLKKIVTINNLINRIHFISDIKHWNKENYWATPLETIGTNYGDTEDISLLKYVLMVKVGLNPNDIQLIKKDVPFKRNHKKYSENLSLFYFTKNHINPLVIDYDFRGKKIYKYKDQFKFKYVKTSPNKHWDVLFKKNLHSTDLDKISKLESNINLKDDVHIFY